MELDKNTAVATAILTMLVTGIIGGVIYSVYDTGKELTCATNKPTGWVVESVSQINGMEISAAYCPYTTKDWVYANCSAFRKTSSYSRYGCNEVLVAIKQDIKPDDDIITQPRINGNIERCSIDGCMMIPRVG